MIRGGAAMVVSAPGRPRPIEKARAGLWLLLICPPWVAATPVQNEPVRLPDAGTIFEREISGTEAHRYVLGTSPGEDVWITINQDGIDLTVSIIGADGENRLSVDNPGGRWGVEWLYVEGKSPHVETLEIRALTPNAAPGRYRLSVQSRFPTSPADPRRIAERAVTEAGRLSRSGTRQAWRRALEHYRAALASWQVIGQRADTAHTLFVLAMLHRMLEEPGKALPLLHDALTVWQSLGHRQAEAQTLMETASTVWVLGESGRSERIYQQALELWRNVGDLQGQALTLNYLGLVRARSAPHSALEPYEEALELFRRTGDTLWEGVVLNNLGGIHDLMGEPHLALEHFHQALGVYQRLGDLRREAGAWNNIATVHRRTGRLQEALDGFRAALKVRRQLDDRRGEGRVLNNLGLTWLRLGDASRALDTLREALVLRRATADRRGEAITLNNLGQAHASLEQWDQALETWKQALDLRRALEDRTGTATTLIEMGRASSRLGRLAVARQYLEESIDTLEDIGNPWRQARAWSTLGEILIASGEPEKAISALERATQLYQTTGVAVGKGKALLALARAERAAAARRDGTALANSYAHAMEALSLLEAVRADVDSLGLRVSFLSHHEDAFRFTIDLAMELHRREPSGGWAAKALEISERARARSLLDLLKESEAGLRRGVDAVLLERQQELLERLNAKVDRRRQHLERQGPASATARLDRETRQVQAELEEVENRIRRQSPGWAALARPRPLGVGAVQALLDPSTTLLEYALGEERSFLWVVAPHLVESYELPGRREIEAASREAYEGWRIHDPRALRADADAADRLSEILLAPAADRLAGQRLAIVADGALHYVSFAALPHPAAPTEPLIARHEIVSLPSASALGVQRQVLAGRPPAPKTLAVVADPVFGEADPRFPTFGDTAAPRKSPLTLAARNPVYRYSPSADRRLERLSWSRFEAESIAGRLAADQTFVALDFDAGLDAVRGNRLKGYRIVHFATHGIVESEYPELSALVLSLYDAQGRPREGFLRLPEIYNLELDAELVVLSGCETALGREIRGEGMVGLTRGFFAAGARRLVASLWRVQDRSAAELMDRFYRHLLESEEPMPPAAALRAAQLELMREPELRDPYHWAAFAVYGDWR